MKAKILTLLMLMALAAPYSYGIGVGLSTELIEFTPNLNENFLGIIYNNVGEDIKVELKAKGDLSEYATFGQETLDIPAGESSSFTFNIKLPEKIPPGLNKMYIGAEDITSSQSSGISARTAAFSPLVIREKYPGKYIEASLSSGDVAEGGTAVFQINLVSRGSVVIRRIDGVFEVFNNGEKIKSINLEPLDEVQPGQSSKMSAEWNTTGNPIGKYDIKAALNYDGKELTLESSFRIGALIVKIIDFTKEVYKDEINRFDIIVKNFWNSEISNVYAEIYVGGQKTKTLETALGAWSEGAITTYLDTYNLGVGEHKASIKVYYAQSAAETTGMIKILPKRERIVEVPSEAKRPVALIALVLLLVLVNIFIIVFFIRHQKRLEQEIHRPKNERRK